MELKLVDIVHDFGRKRVLDNLTLTMTPGVYGLLGPNGTGKTTLMRIIADVLRPTGGRVLLDGRDKDALGEMYRAELGYLPQDLGLYGYFSGRDFLQYIAALKGINRKEAGERIRIAAETVNLTQDLDKLCRKYSGGMKRRLGIAQALLNQPRLLILDEPTVGLDPMERVRFRNLISEIASQRIVILSTHIVPDVDHVAKQVMLLKGGRVIRQGTISCLTSTLEGQVWRVWVSERHLARFEEKANIVNRRQLDNGLELRIISPEAPSADAVPLEPSLEDVYMHIYKGEEA